MGDIIDRLVIKVNEFDGYGKKCIRLNKPEYTELVMRLNDKYPIYSDCGYRDGKIFFMGFEIVLI